MLIRPHERDAFLNFVEINAALWRIEDAALAPSVEGRVLIADLLSHDLHQSIRSLYVTKIMQRLLHCPIVGLVGNLRFSRDLEFEYDKAEAIRLGRSYGLNSFLDLEDTASKTSIAEALITPEKTAEAIAAIRAAEDDVLASLVLGWTAPDGCRIGEYIYETTLRIARNPFLSEVRPCLEDVTLEAHRIYNTVVDYCSLNRVEAVAAGHVSYTQWGMTIDVILRAGGRCVWFDCTGNFSAYLLTRPPNGCETLSSMIRGIDRKLFEEHFRERGKMDHRFVRKVQDLFSSDYFLRPFWWEPTKSPPKSLVRSLRKTALGKLGWQGADCPVICIFIHCLSDLPRDDEQIYLDYFVWIYESLKIAARDRTRKWIFKTHPANRGGYDITNATERLKEEFATCEHIYFLEDELEKVEVFAVCDLVVTVRGSIAYEMSVFGKPALLAGRSVLSDLGFCHVAQDEADYERLLMADLSQLALTPEMQARASFYLIYDKIACRVESTFMPYWTYRLTGDGNIWDSLTERILHNISDLDPLASALSAMLSGGAQRTLNPGYRALPATKEDLPGIPSNELTSTFLSDTLAFGRNANGIPWLLTKAIRTDDMGSWFGPGHPAFIGIALDPDRLAKDAALLALSFTCTSATTAAALNIQIDSGEPVRVLLHAEGTIVRLADLSIGKCEGDNPFAFRLWVSDMDGTSVEFRLDGISLQASFEPPSQRDNLLARLRKRLGHHA